MDASRTTPTLCVLVMNTGPSRKPPSSIHAVPVISPVEQLPGLFIATGFSGHGFGIGPGAGRLMADLVTGAPPIVDPAPYRFARFSNGSQIEIIAGF